ncbi:DUF2637 domain-containing protein [Nesterenkonia alkaliphila]|nr:DUF2637 domain-containing protein [Nesterenkonia alkaliphila]
MTGAPTRSRRSQATVPVMIAVTGTLGLAGAAFVLSFTALRDLAVLAGIPAQQAWLWPLVVDGVILEATISVVALRDGTGPARRFAWLLLTGGAGISVAANITHAIVIADDRVPAIIAAFVASVPPLTLVAMTHLTVELIRNTAPPSPQPTSPVTPSTNPRPGEEPANENGAGPKPRLVDRPEEPPIASSVPRSREERRALAIALATDPDRDLSLRQVAERVGVHPTTVGRWVAAPDRQPPVPAGATAKGRNDDEPDT